jgi:hypothetical protein
VLAALLANNQNIAARPGTLYFDHGGGGALGPRYDIVDYLNVLQAFEEIPGEHPVVRAARRQRHVVEWIDGFRELRERREAVAFMAGATLAEGAAAEKHAATQAELATLIATLDQVRGHAEPSSVPRGDRFGSGVGIGIGIGIAIAGAVAVGFALGRRA